MDGFIELVRDMLVDAGCASEDIHVAKHLQVPGYFRPEKKWDLLVVRDRTLIVAAEFKGQIKEFGKNVNNRAEEAIGNAVDLKAAYDHGLVQRGAPRPWFGYLFVLRDCETVRRSQRNTPASRHFRPDAPFQNASYQRRYELLCERLVERDLYQSACFLLADEATAELHEPNARLSFEGFARAACVAAKPRALGSRKP